VAGSDEWAIVMDNADSPLNHRTIVPLPRDPGQLLLFRNKLVAKKRKRQLEEAKRVMELDRNLIVIVVLIVALPIIAALAAMLTVLAVGNGAH
jgi:hypothetical protein